MGAVRDNALIADIQTAIPNRGVYASHLAHPWMRSHSLGPMCHHSGSYHRGAVRNTASVPILQLRPDFV
jgi:hypothetical protein